MLVTLKLAFDVGEPAVLQRDETGKTALLIEQERDREENRFWVLSLCRERNVGLFFLADGFAGDGAVFADVFSIVAIMANFGKVTIGLVVFV